MTYYLKTGNQYRVSDPENLNLHQILPPGTYVVKFNNMNNYYYLETIDNFTIPGKLYGSVDKKATRIIQTFLDRPHSTGVMLAGEKGSGKTLLAKLISNRCAAQGIPTILVNEAHHGDEFSAFIQSIEQPVVILFDEFEKVYFRDQEKVLTLLDGVFPSKKMFLFTCNNKWSLNQYLQNRPGRIYYLLNFDSLEMDFVREYCQENLHNQTHIETLLKFTTVFSEFNFDMLKAIVEEMNRYDESPQEVIGMLNTKPEFSQEQEYDIELLVPNCEIDELSDETWSGNPFMNNIRTSYLPVGGEWQNVIFEPSDVQRIDKASNKIMYALASGVQLTLTKKVTRMSNFFAL